MQPGYAYYLYNLREIFGTRSFRGWGRKRTGKFAKYCHTLFGGEVILEEDGFIRSIGLVTEENHSFSRVEDYSGIYYDASTPSDLEKILNVYDFDNDPLLLKHASAAMAKMRSYYVSKYNLPLSENNDILEEYFSSSLNCKRECILVVTQTAGDSSLIYGWGMHYRTEEMIYDALNENPEAIVYVKIHPDVVSGRKRADIDMKDLPDRCCIIDTQIEPMQLLRHIDKVYTKTSGMGMEALIMGKEVHCYGMPFYAGWGLTQDKIICKRRRRKLSIEALFAGTYILYTYYTNPDDISQKADIMEIIEYIGRYRREKDEIDDEQ